jgi:hypothetical protein
MIRELHSHAAPRVAQIRMTQMLVEARFSVEVFAQRR